MTKVDISPQAPGSSAGIANFGAHDPPIFTFVLVKLASRCNINCTYCYWFRDAEVYRKPAVLTAEAESAFCERLEQHIEEFGLEHFILVFHGGEPLLFPKHRFIELQEKLLAIQHRTGCRIERGVAPTPILIDREWAEIFKRYGVMVSVSLDGPPEIQRQASRRFQRQGHPCRRIAGHRVPARRRESTRGSSRSAIRRPTRNRSCRTWSRSSASSSSTSFRPDATHSDNPPQIADYFIKLFDVWFDRFAAQGVRIKTLDSMIQGLLGNLSVSDTVGLGPIETVTLMTDGSLEPLDVLRIIGDGSTKTDSSVLKNVLQDVQSDPRWREAYEASLRLCDTCLKCEYLDACGGGHLAQRWSRERRFDNPSVYCESWKRIFGHMWKRISPTLVVEYQSTAATHASAPGAAPQRS